jgi:hypothetical protein
MRSVLFRDTTFTGFYLSFTFTHILDVNIITGITYTYIGQNRNYFEAVFGSFVLIRFYKFFYMQTNYYRVSFLQVGQQNYILNFRTNV